MRPLVDQYLAKLALDEHATYSGPPAFAPEEPAPVVTTEAAKYLNERRDENRTDNRNAPSALPMLGAKEAMRKTSSDKPWEKDAPEGKKKSTLTDAQKDAARRRAAEAGRKYPNLIDNMWAAGQGKKADEADVIVEIAEAPSKIGSEDALILLGLPHDWAEKLAAGAWQRAEGKNPEGGLNAKGRASLKAEGHNIKPPVSSEQAKKSPKAAARRKSFCARMGGMPGPMKKDNGEPTRKALALRKWDC